MTRLLIFTCLFFIAGDCVSAPVVWLSPRTDGVIGTGTESNPYDASTRQKFDALMRSFWTRFPGELVVELTVGRFDTSGEPSYNESEGWWVREGWTIRGRDPSLTELRMDVFPANTQGNAHGVIALQYTALGGVTIENLTVNENYQAGVWPVDCNTFAVRLFGNSNTVRNVWAMGGYGYLAFLRESFSISICSRFNGSFWETNTAGLIESCVVSGYRGDYGLAISMLGGPDGTGGAGGVVRDCIVRNFIGTSAFGLGHNVTFTGNTTIGCKTSFYSEGNTDNVIITSNRMFSGIGPVVYSFPGVSATINGLSISNNLIETTSGGVAIALSNNQTGQTARVSISSNTIMGPSDSYGINAAYVNGISVTDNLLSPGVDSLRWDEYPSTGVFRRGNRILGSPVGLEDTN